MNVIDIVLYYFVAYLAGFSKGYAWVVEMMCNMIKLLWSNSLFVVVFHVVAFFALMAAGFIPWLLVCSIYIAMRLAWATGEPSPWLDKDGRFRW